MVSRDSEGRPEVPEGLLETLIQELEGEDAPFVKHLDKELGLKWLDEDESRLGFTRFELGPSRALPEEEARCSAGPHYNSLEPYSFR